MSLYDAPEEEILDAGPDGLHTVAEWREHLRKRGEQLRFLESDIARKQKRAALLRRDLENLSEVLDSLASDKKPEDLAFLKPQAE